MTNGAHPEKQKKTAGRKSKAKAAKTKRTKPWIAKAVQGRGG